MYTISYTCKHANIYVYNCLQFVYLFTKMYTVSISLMKRPNFYYGYF